MIQLEKYGHVIWVGEKKKKKKSGDWTIKKQSSSIL